MIKLLIEILTGKNCVKLTPALGTLNEKNIETYHLLDEHPLNPLVPGTSEIEEADGHQVNGALNFDIYDIYHTLKLSFLPPKHRIGVMRFIYVLRKLNKKEANLLAQDLTDGELHNVLFKNH